MPYYRIEKCSPDEIILRIERQTLRRIPESEAIAFTIRIHRWPLEIIGKDTHLSKDLIRALEMIPDEVSEYKKETVALSKTAQQYLLEVLWTNGYEMILRKVKFILSATFVAVFGTACNQYFWVGGFMSSKSPWLR